MKLDVHCFKRREEGKQTKIGCKYICQRGTCMGICASAAVRKEASMNPLPSPGNIGRLTFFLVEYARLQ